MLSVSGTMNIADFHVPFLGAGLGVSMLALRAVCICQAYPDRSRVLKLASDEFSAKRGLSYHAQA